MLPSSPVQYVSIIFWAKRSSFDSQINRLSTLRERERERNTLEIAWARDKWVCPSVLGVDCTGWAFVFLMACRELSFRDRKHHHSYAWVGWEQHSANFTAKLPSKSSDSLQVGHNSNRNWKEAPQGFFLASEKSLMIFMFAWRSKCTVCGMRQVFCEHWLWSGMHMMLFLLSIHVN